MLIGLGKQVKKVIPQGPYTISFSIYDSSYPATQTGDAPVVTDKMAGETFIIPSQGNLVRTEVTYESPPGGGPIQQVPTNINLYAWTDGNAIYFPGDTYTMPNSNITLKAIWATLYSPTLSLITPDTGSPGDTIVLTGANLGSTTQIRFNRNKYATFTVKNDNEISIVVPGGATTGNIALNLISGSLSIIWFERI